MMEEEQYKTERKRLSGLLSVMIFSSAAFPVLFIWGVFSFNEATLSMQMLLVAVTGSTMVFIALTLISGRSNWKDDRDIRDISKRLDEFYSPLVGYFINNPKYYAPTIESILLIKSHLRDKAKRNPLFDNCVIDFESMTSEGMRIGTSVVFREPKGSGIWNSFLHDLRDEYVELMTELGKLLGEKKPEKLVLPRFKSIEIQGDQLSKG